MSFKYFFNKIKDVKFADYMEFIPMIIAILIYPLKKRNYANSWLICEDPYEARDNGYHFFKYMVKEHPEIKCYYAIKRKSIDREKVAKLGTIIEYGSIKHWLIYFSCKYNISSQKGGKPNAAICSFMELNNIFKTKNIFLQHGVTINNPSWLHHDKCRFYRFVTSAIPEYKFILREFGYAKEVLMLTGMPRFDALHDANTNKKRIVIMPTWRVWFNLKSKRKDNLNCKFISSNYLLGWKKLLENEKLKSLILNYNLEVIFYPHRNMQIYLKEMRQRINTDVIIASAEDYDIQDLLKTSVLMITDYSSVFFDMIYQKKPVVFYQFDKNDFRMGQYDKGYFDYENNDFAECYENDSLVVNALEKFIKNEFACSDKFLEAYEYYFPFSDSKNSERIYNSLKLESD